jgi:LPS export ABC transporter protein LptC
MRNLNKIRRVLAVIVFLVTAYITVKIVNYYHNLKPPADKLVDLPKNIDLSLQKVHYTNTKDGTLQYDLVAERVESDNDLGMIRLTTVQMTLNGNGKSGKYLLKADTADYHRKTGDIKLVGNVVAANESGMKFTTGHVEYFAARSLITTNDRVKVSDGNFTLDGTGMEIRVDTKQVHVLRDITAVVGSRKK